MSMVSSGTLPANEVFEACKAAIAHIKAGREEALNRLIAPYMKGGFFSKAKTREQVLREMPKIEIEIIEFHRLLEENQIRCLMGLAMAVNRSAEGMLMSVSSSDFALVTDFFGEEEPE